MPTSGELIYVKQDKIVRHDFAAKAERPLATIDGRVINLVMSPDRQWVSFELIGGNLYTMKTDGSQRYDLGTGYQARWSPDSRFVVYMIATDDGHQYTSADIYIASRDGNLRQPVTNTQDILEMNPSWSPDGRWIAYNTLTEGRIYIQQIQIK